MINFGSRLAKLPIVGRAFALTHRLYVPRSARGKMPLVVMIHGCAQNAAAFERGTEMNEYAEANGFCVLYPNQNRSRNFFGCWNWFDPVNRQPKGGEAGEIFEMVQQVIRDQPIDTEKIFVAGLSSGTTIAAALLACHPETFAGATLSSGPALETANNALSGMAVMHLGPHDPSSPGQLPCVPQMDDKRLVVIQGMSDLTVNPKHARKLIAQFLPPKAKESRRELKLRAPGERAVGVTEFTTAKSEILLVEVEKMRHAWAGGKHGEPFFDPKAFSATELTVRYLVRGERPFADEVIEDDQPSLAQKLS